MRHRPKRPAPRAALTLLTLLLEAGCTSHVEPAGAVSRPAPAPPAHRASAAPTSCAPWKSGSYLTEITGLYPLRFAPGDTVPEPAPAFEEAFVTEVSSRVTARVGDESYVFVFTEDRGDAAHVFVFQELPGRYCVAGIWETTFGGNGVRTQIKSSWQAPDGHRLLVLLRSTSLSRGYYYDRKPGETCPPEEGDGRPDPNLCHVLPEFDAYFNVLSLDTRAHRFVSVYASDQEGRGRHSVAGYDDGYEGEPSFVPTANGLELTGEGTVYRWNETEGAFELIQGSLPE